jgi:hypothetical protein
MKVIRSWINSVSKNRDLISFSFLLHPELWTHILPFLVDLCGVHLSSWILSTFYCLSRQNHVPWGWFSLWKWVPGISPGGKAASAYGWRPTTLVVLNVKKIRGLNLPGTPWATSAFCGMTFTFTFYCQYLWEVSKTTWDDCGIFQFFFWVFLPKHVLYIGRQNLSWVN